MPPEDPKSDLPSEDKPIVFVDDPNKPRSPKMDLTLEDSEELIECLTEHNKELEDQNLRLIEEAARDRKIHDGMIEGLRSEIRTLRSNCDEAWKIRNELRDENYELEDRVGRFKCGMAISIVSFIIALGGLCLVGILYENKIERLKTELAVATARTVTVTISQTSEPVPPEVVGGYSSVAPINTEPLTSMYVGHATLLKAEPAGERWPLIIQLDDGRKMRVFVKPERHYRAMSDTKFGHIPFHNFIIRDYVVIDPNWRDPDEPDGPLFKFSLDDYPKKEPKFERPEY